MLLLGHRGTALRASMMFPAQAKDRLERDTGRLPAQAKDRLERGTAENTIPAFELTLEHGCDGIEFDVRLTSDGRAAVCHDRYFGGREIARSTLSELLTHDAALPSLEEVVTRFHRRAFLYIELKVAGLEAATLASVLNNPPERGYVVASFLPEVVLEMHRLDPAVPLGLICGRAHEFAMWRELPIEYVMARYTLITRGLVDELHVAGKRVMVWTVNSERDMRKMAEYGVDGMMSDDTKLLCRAVRTAIL